MFEKSLVDLIRGLRSHKGNETEYIQSILKECRSEVKSQDMDVKTTALLKLIYLEMFGYDMSWASFNVLEVMSSAKYGHKRVGYLGAVQSFRPDTEVLMLATNLLKKDITSPQIPTLSLPLLTLPHIITSSLALSLLSDLLPRLSHSNPAVRKKTIVTLYRLALVYPETLRVAWPKIKERLLDEEEDGSVTAAVVNVVCELGWRRPHDFLPLAPRLFDLLVDGGNNWMAIKIIKLFATLTPLEPRLVRKLLRPLTNLIQTTSAMSLMYECVNGIIQGGILEESEGSAEGDDIAKLCVSKLRSMIIVEGDPNLKYVALLAFNRIVTSYPNLVSMQQDVIMECLDDPDVSIRLQALELTAGMISGDNLQPIVNRLIKQLRNSPIQSDQQAPLVPMHIEPHADSDDEDPEANIKPDRRPTNEYASLTNEYRQELIHRILDMCSHEIYAKITDFEWYLDSLVQLIRFSPSLDKDANNSSRSLASGGQHTSASESVSGRIGWQIRDIAVRVRSVRSEATHAAESLVLLENRESLFPPVGNAGLWVLEPLAWVIGEYAEYLTSPRSAMDSLIHHSSLSLPPSTLSSYVQAIPKVFNYIISTILSTWSSTERTSTSLLLARITEFLEKLATHPSLDVQERTIEFLELLKLASESLAAQTVDSEEPPLLLTSALPSLFAGMELNPVAIGAQSKVPLPEELDLDAQINPLLETLLRTESSIQEDAPADDEYRSFYYKREVTEARDTGRVKFQEPPSEPSSYQDLPINEAERRARKRAEQQERYKDDPFYIANDELSSAAASPFHQVLKGSNGDDLDLDSIPIIDLKLDPQQANVPSASTNAAKKSRKVIKKFQITADENIDLEDSADSRPRTPNPPSKPANHRLQRPKNALLHVDSSGLETLSLEESIGGQDSIQFESQRREVEEKEMAEAMKEVERLRLEMQRAAERVEAVAGVPEEGTVVRKKKKKKNKVPLDQEAGAALSETGMEPLEETSTVKRKKKKPKTDRKEDQKEDVGAAADEQIAEQGIVKKKRKRKPKVITIEDSEA
ncbi:MAG: hypothetical protein Q9160_005801 [Pyrenula sp. 1 TL-2023]